MKKLIKISAFLLAVSASALFTSCQDVIFETVREEVKLTDAQITGDVYDIIRYTDSADNEYLFVTNGKIWRKDITAVKETGTDTADLDALDLPITESYTGNWEQFTAPEKCSSSKHKSNFQTITSNAGGDLYVARLCTTTDDDTNVRSEGTVLRYDSTTETWEPVSFKIEYTDTDGNTATINLEKITLSGLFCVFGTNTPNKDERKAFANVNGAIYSLSGTTATKVEESSSSNYDATVKIYAGAAELDGKLYFVDYKSTITSNADYTNAATTLYKGKTSSKTISYLKSGDTEWTDISVSSNIGTIYSIGVTKGGLFLGTSAGAKFLPFETDSDSNYTVVPSTVTGSLPSSTASTLSSYYFIPHSLVLNPAKMLEETDVYATINFSGTPGSTSATLSKVGLWAYYRGRGKWNCE